MDVLKRVIFVIRSFALQKLDAKLSDAAPLLKTGTVPMPILTAATVKDDVMASEFHGTF